jgi:hypothetical protein
MFCNQCGHKLPDNSKFCNECGNVIKTVPQSKYDIFLSYRRDGGEAMATLLRDRLVAKGYRVFFDIEGLNSGSFNTALLTVIEDCTDFVLIGSKGCLDRCVNDGDWVRLEIAHALKNNKNIVPIMMRDFAFPDVLPEDIEALRLQNGVNANSHEYFDAAIERLSEKFLKSKPINVPQNVETQPPQALSVSEVTEKTEKAAEVVEVVEADESPKLAEFSETAVYKNNSDLNLYNPPAFSKKKLLAVLGGVVAIALIVIIGVASSGDSEPASTPTRRNSATTAATTVTTAPPLPDIVGVWQRTRTTNGEGVILGLFPPTAPDTMIVRENGTAVYISEGAALVGSITGSLAGAAIQDEVGGALGNTAGGLVDNFIRNNQNGVTEFTWSVNNQGRTTLSRLPHANITNASSWRFNSSGSITFTYANGSTATFTKQ